MIDGIEVEVTAGVPLPLAPGQHRVSLTRSDGSQFLALIEIAAGSTAQVHD